MPLRIPVSGEGDFWRLCPAPISAAAYVAFRGSYRLAVLSLSAILCSHGHTRAPPARFPLPDRASLGSSSAVWPCLPLSSALEDRPRPSAFARRTAPWLSSTRAEARSARGGRGCPDRWR